MQFLRAAHASRASGFEKTSPGLSKRLICLSSEICCTERVIPGALPTCATLERFKLLIRELLPTLGSPTMPACQGRGLQMESKFALSKSSISVSYSSSSPGFQSAVCS